MQRVVLGAAGGLFDVSAPGLLTISVFDGNGGTLAVASFQADAGFAAMILLEV